MGIYFITLQFIRNHTVKKLLVCLFVCLLTRSFVCFFFTVGYACVCVFAEPVTFVVLGQWIWIWITKNHHKLKMTTQIKAYFSIIEFTFQMKCLGAHDSIKSTSVSWYNRRCFTRMCLHVSALFFSCSSIYMMLKNDNCWKNMCPNQVQFTNGNATKMDGWWCFKLHSGIKAGE